MGSGKMHFAFFIETERIIKESTLKGNTIMALIQLESEDVWKILFH